METSYKNISLFFITILAFVIWGFFRTYFGLFPSFTGITTVQHFHGVMMLCWFAMLIAQPMLIRYQQYEWHKRLGALSYIIIPLLLISIFLVGKGQYNRMTGLVSKQENIGGMALSIPDIVAFGALYFLAMINRKNTAYHMRYMIATSLLMLGPGTGRALIIYGGLSFPQGIEYSSFLTELIAVGFIVYDRIKQKPYKPYLVTLLILIGMHLIWEFQLSWWWQAFAGKFATLFF